ncbi:hypothetical protein QQ045_021498 [Rhodiola kirilowii]
MASKTKSTGPATPVKASNVLTKPKSPEVVENCNPNLASRSPAIKSAKSLKSVFRNPNLSGKRKAVAPNKESNADDGGDFSSRAEEERITAEAAKDGHALLPTENGEDNAIAAECGLKVEMSVESGGICRTNIKRGNVMNLIQAFERILTLPPDNGNALVKEEDCASDDALKKRPLLDSTETTQSSSSCGLDSFRTPDNLHLDTWDGSSLSQESISKRTSGGGRTSRRNSSESSETSGLTRSKKTQLGITNQKPFKLRTEQRGKVKEVELLCKIQQMVEEQEKKRLRIAQGLPWTTEEPQCLIKPPVKEITRPMDVKLHTDMRAVERAEFDHQVAEKMSSFEQYKMERVRQQKLAEEAEIRMLRKELVPKAQPMPYFDRPFVPKRASKHQNKKGPNFKSHTGRRLDAGCSQ